jgi:HSP20 family protein
MQLVRREPWWVAELDRDMGRLLGEAFGPWVDPRGHRVLPVADRDRWVPACDVFDRDGDLVIRVELPGINPDTDVRVTVQDGVLWIGGERKQDDAVADGGRYWRQERAYGAFERGVRVPDGVRVEDITASYDKGMLEVVVPKAAQLPGPQRIEVRVNGKKELAEDRG